ncbi:MAG TPA: ATP-binding protein [Thermoanaerobaculia bacterium]|nr:ATP-binding protein [Thermoanaerobaculia bacterium]
MANTDSTLSRRLLYGTILVGILILCNLALFGMLLFRSLSEQEIRRILLETRSEAEQIAQELAGEIERGGDADLFTALVQEQETQTYIDRVLAKREIVATVRIFDRDGTLVFENRRESSESADTPVRIDITDPPAIETRVLHREIPYDVVEVPVGELGSFVIGISRAELERRAGQLRADLIRSAAPIAVLTLVVLVGAYLFILWLVRRAKKLEGRAKEAEQLAYVGTLASGLAHEIRSPLNSLNLNMQMLEEEAAEGDHRPNRRLFAITRAEVTRLENLVTDFLSYARPRPLALVRVRAIDLLEQLREVLAGQLRSGSIEVAVADRTAGAEVDVDVDQMRQLLLNLVQNGLTAAEEAGRPPRILLTAERQGGRVVLGVEDNGVGIPPELSERVFELFYSTRKGGTGLGLAIARRIAHEHDGEVAHSSIPGEGTRALVSLPAAPPRPRTHAAPALEEGVASSG